MVELFAKLTFWHWWVLAGLLLILELLLPGAFFIWTAAAALGIGLLLLLFSGMSWPVQFLLFAVLSVIAILVGRFYVRKHPIKTDQPELNRRGKQYVGRVFVLDEATVNGVGRVRVGDSFWRVQGAEDAPAGCKVEVVRVEGASFVVRIAEARD